MDPVKDGGNWYVYCANNPLKYKDPNGLQTIALPWTNVAPLPYWVCPGYVYPAAPLDDYNVPNNSVDNSDDLSKRKERNKKILEKMKKEPPRHPDYKPPKNWDGKKKKAGDKSGWPHKNRDIWVPDDHNGTHDPHWDMQHPDGTHTPKYPESGAYDDILDMIMDFFHDLFKGNEENINPNNYNMDINGDGIPDANGT